MLRRPTRRVPAEDVPLRYDRKHGQWIVSGYDEVRAALADWRAFSSRPMIGIDPVLLGADGPGHDRARRLAARFFSAAAIEPSVRAVERLAPALIRPAFDLVSEFAAPLTRRAAGTLVGLADAEVEEVVAAFRAARAAGGPRSGPAAPPEPTSRAAIREILAPQLDDPRALDSLIALLCLAAVETSERAIARSAIRLFADPALRERLVSDPASLPRYVEEMLRLYPPTPAVLRVVSVPTTLAGEEMEPGTPVRLEIAAANRDPRHFDRPDELRLDRARNPHLSFGGGTHLCIGSGLARRTISAALAALLAHRPRLRALEPCDRGVGRGLPDDGVFPDRLVVGHD